MAITLNQQGGIFDCKVIMKDLNLTPYKLNLLILSKQSIYYQIQTFEASEFIPTQNVKPPPPNPHPSKKRRKNEKSEEEKK